MESVTHPTEDAEKVKAALLSMFPTLLFKAENQVERVFLVAEGNRISDLSQIRDLIRKERVSDAARRTFRSNTVYGKTIVHLNKQVAMVGHVSFCAPEGESPLGPITLTLESDSLDEVIDWLAPRTRQHQRGT